MVSAALLTLTLASLSTAQSTVSLFLPGFDNQTLIASVIASDATATTYAVVCPSDTAEEAEDCGLAGGVILTQGPATLAYTMSFDDIPTSGTVTSSVNVFTGYLDCSLGGTTTAVCTESDGGLEANFPGISTYTFAATDITYQVAALTTSSLSVAAYEASSTSGASVASTTSSGVASTTSTGSKTTSTGSSTGTKASTSGSSSASGAAKSSSTSTGGMAMITGNAQWVMGGAALAAALL